jgi:recombination protein RecR
MAHSLKPIEKLTREFSKLPGMGLKTATRLAYYVVRMGEDSVNDLSEAIQAVHREVTICPKCYGYALNSGECDVCSDGARDSNYLCVVERPQDVFVIERGDFNGRYHVLNGVVSPLDGIGPDDIKLNELIERIKKERPQEVVVALNSSVEGDATTLYIAKLLNGMDVRVSRLARGVPAGASIDYVDDTTLCRALEERQDVVC